MKIAVFSDLHANGSVLDAFAKETKENGIKKYWFLGDAVGYGPNPEKVLRWILSNISPKRCVWGNHDLMLHGLVAAQSALFCKKTGVNPIEINANGINIKIIQNFMRTTEWQLINRSAIQIIQEHTKELSTAKWFNNRVLVNIYRDKRIKTFNFYGIKHWFVHGTIDNYGDNFRYLFPWKNVYLELELSELKKNRGKRKQVHWSGHTHVPMLLIADKNDVTPKPIFIRFNKKYSIDYPYVFINPGSLGFPRDLCSGGSYILYFPKEKEVEFRRVEYSKIDVYDQMHHKGYPTSVLNHFRDATFPEMGNAFEYHFRKLKKEGC